MSQREQVLILVGSPRQVAPSSDNRHTRRQHVSELRHMTRDRESLFLLFLRSRWDYPSAYSEVSRIETVSRAVT